MSRTHTLNPNRNAERVAYRSRDSKPKRKLTWRERCNDAKLKPLDPAKPPASLSPGAYLTQAYVEGDTVARAIVNAWAPQFAITIQEAA